MQTKKYKGFAIKAPPHLNLKQEPNRYVFSGVEIASGELYHCSFGVIPLPGFTTPEEFAAVVATHIPLPGDMEVFPPDWLLGKFSYLSPTTGGTGSARAEDIKSLSKEQLMPPPGREPTLERIKTREVLQPAPRMPRHPALDDGMDMTF